METPKFSELSIILEKGESKYEPHLVLPTEEQCEKLLNKLEEKSVALRAEVDRLQGFSDMASGVTAICEEVDQMIDDYVETNARELNQSFQTMFEPKKSPRGNRSNRNNRLNPSPRNARVSHQRSGSYHF